MNEKQIQSIEKKFSITLPNGYRKMLASTPPLLLAWLNYEEKENPGQSPFFVDHRMIAGVNQMMRDPDDEEYFAFDPNDDSKPWPQRYFIIGSDVGGNFYCIAPASNKSRVYFWNQGDTAFPKYADTMAGFVKRLFKDYGEVAAMDCESDT
ncbi:SMI1/KNR4 family protein [Mariniblastus sp.]|jgi:hypothetical protein|nr:SMI1/KNR4 family protein [Mariniblastus sp.]MDB4370978.1 SMI1/KNR4 family protein [Mariniblastus sp.]